MRDSFSDALMDAVNNRIKPENPGEELSSYEKWIQSQFYLSILREAQALELFDECGIGQCLGQPYLPMAIYRAYKAGFDAAQAKS